MTRAQRNLYVEKLRVAFLRVIALSDMRDEDVAPDAIVDALDTVVTEVNQYARAFRRPVSDETKAPCVKEH